MDKSPGHETVADAVTGGSKLAAGSIEHAGETRASKDSGGDGDHRMAAEDEQTPTSEKTKKKRKKRGKKSLAQRGPTDGLRRYSNTRLMFAEVDGRVEAY